MLTTERVWEEDHMEMRLICCSLRVVCDDGPDQVGWRDGRERVGKKKKYPTIADARLGSLNK